jgi:hypothetical protein
MLEHLISLRCLLFCFQHIAREGRGLHMVGVMALALWSSSVFGGGSELSRERAR